MRRFARKIDGEKAGEERKLTTALIRSEIGGLRAVDEELPGDGFLCVFTDASRSEEGEKWGEEDSGARTPST